MKPLLLLALFILSTFTTLACDCLMMPVEHHIKNTSYLLTAEVVEILDARTPEGRAYRHWLRISNQDSTRGFNVRLRVLESFKGKFVANDTIELQSDYSSCSMHFALGEKSILFLHEEKKGLFITPCSYSNRLNGSKYANDLQRKIQTRTRRKRRD
ncbi:hypothetical protein [Hymenobacter koreensis]|uniref:hypothetical protein n=1 Tax=Hymenobacter koreensis TaxID=1084523 RepID=UPI0031E7993C